jgi:predicted nuclease of predicted toxin-antitoxin system
VTFVVDEDMPRSTSAALSNEGYGVKDVRDHGYRGSGDDEVYAFAQREMAVCQSLVRRAGRNSIGFEFLF